MGNFNVNSTKLTENEIITIAKNIYETIGGDSGVIDMFGNNVDGIKPIEALHNCGGIKIELNDNFNKEILIVYSGIDVKEGYSLQIVDKNKKTILVSQHNLDLIKVYALIEKYKQI